MKMIILAAGYATRLYPLTLDQPKPLLKIAGRPMVEHILSKAEQVDELDEIFIVTNNKFYNHFADWLNSYSSNKKINIVNDKTMTNDDRLGAVGDIHYVIEHENIDEDLIVVAGDNLFDFSLKEMVKLSNDRKASVIAAFDLQDKSKLSKKFGVVEIDSDSKVIGFEEKPENPKTSLAATCVYVLIKEDVEEFETCINENNKPDNAGDFIRHLSSKKPVYCFVSKEQWIDIGSPEQLKEADELWSRKLNQ